MGAMSTPNIFQEKVSNLTEILEFARTYLENLLYLAKGCFNDHLVDIEEFSKCKSQGKCG